LRTVVGGRGLTLEFTRILGGLTGTFTGHVPFAGCEISFV
jgi:hypothetical protein